MLDSIAKVFFSSSILRTFFGFPSELDMSTGLHDVAVTVVIQFDCFFHTLSPSKHFFVPKSSCLSPLQPQIVFTELCFHLELSGLLSRKS